MPPTTPTTPTAASTATQTPTSTTAPITTPTTLTSAPTAMLTPAAHTDPDGPSPACRKPEEDYTRTTINGEAVNRRTEAMLATADEIYDGPADLFRVVQGSYTDAVEGSFGTHDGGGAVDLSIRDPANPNERLFDEVPALIEALRLAGFAAWYRDWHSVYDGSVPHIHAIAIGDAELSEAAALQLTGPAGYFRGMDGLPLDPPQKDGHGGPVVCGWMVEAGYGVDGG